MDDYPAMLARLEGRMSREDVASAIGVQERELDEIASGYVPDDDVADRLRALSASGTTTRVTRIPAWAIVTFVVVDALVFGALALVLLLR